MVVGICFAFINIGFVCILSVVWVQFAFVWIRFALESDALFVIRIALVVQVATFAFFLGEVWVL